VTLAAGCHSVWILGHAGGSGARRVYPSTTAFTVNVADSVGCADSVPPPPAACETGSDGGVLAPGAH
jgi:hypothetical protein